MKPILYESTVVNAFLRKLMLGITAVFAGATAAAEQVAEFAVSTDDTIVIVGKSTPLSGSAPASFTVSATNPIVISGTEPLRPANFTTTSMNSVIIVGANPNNQPALNGNEAGTDEPRPTIAPASFSVTAASSIVIRGTKPDELSPPASFNVTANKPIIIQGVSPIKLSSPASFSVTSNNAIEILGKLNAGNPSNIQGKPDKINILPKSGSFASDKQSSKGDDGNRQTPSAATLHFIPLVSLVQVSPLTYRREQVQPFSPDTVVTQIEDRIQERRELVASGGASNGNGGGNNSGGDNGGGNSGGGFTAESLPVNGSLPISSTSGQINLDYNPNGMRSLRVFNEDSTSPMPIRRVLTTSGVSAGAVQINIDDDFFAVHSRVPASDVISAPGGQTIIVRDYTDNSYLQIQITVGSANFFGDHTVENIVGWYCGADPADCPL